MVPNGGSWMREGGYESSRTQVLRRIHGSQYERTLEELKREREDRSERALLPPYASLSSQTRGRLLEEGESDNRTQYTRDRDRIIYSEAFFRLSGKTQVFLSPNNPLISTRMTHTVQVSQIARSLARALRLNEDLVEAIALGHDLGHPPFGHAGEEVLDRKCREHGLGGFHHNIQSLHTVDTLERGGKGLNLTWEVREGIVRHDGESDTENITPSDTRGGELWGVDPGQYRLAPGTPEACLVRICDRISYAGKDIEDGIRAGLFEREEIPEAHASVLGNANNQIIDTVVKDIILNFNRFRTGFRESHDREPASSEVVISISPEIMAALNGLIKDFNYPKIYYSRENRRYIRQTNIIVEGLFDAFYEELGGIRKNLPSMSLRDFGLVKEEQYHGVSREHINLFMKHLLRLSYCELEEIERLILDTNNIDGWLINAPEFDRYKLLTHFSEIPLGTLRTALFNLVQSARIKNVNEYVERMKERNESIAYFLKGMEEDYLRKSSSPEIIRDYVASLTDRNAIYIFKRLNIPESVV